MWRVPSPALLYLLMSGELCLAQTLQGHLLMLSGFRLHTVRDELGQMLEGVHVYKYFKSIQRSADIYD